jgi:adenylate kinase
MIIVLIGPPGSGKGTQCKRLVKHFGIPHVSTGEMLREARKQKSPRAHEISEHIDSGRLVSDDLILQLVEDRLSQPDCQRGCLLDGVPRTLAQAKTLDELFRRRGWVLDHVLALEVPADELAARLLARAKVEGRSDDTPETMARRMKIYDDETAPLLEYYRDQGMLRAVAAIGSQEDVFRKILRAVSGQMQAARI